MVFDHNTFYRLAYTQSGLGFGGNLTRGESSGALISNNIFVGGGQPTRKGVSGFYSLGGANMTKEALVAFVTGRTTSGATLAEGIFNDMVTRGYMNSNGKLEPAGRALTSLSQFVLASAYESYRAKTFAEFQKIQLSDAKIRSTTRAEFNFVAGFAVDGYPAMRSDRCTDGIFSSQQFCESNGINGGDPRFKSLTHLLGPDGKFFTLDDGLKPAPDSPACRRGRSGSDIGAYSCDPTKVAAED